jgi:O-antigen/teichoic acid export membrane protein
MAVNTRVIGILAIFACLTGPYVMLLFGPEYKVAWPTLAIVLLSSVVAAAFSPIGHWVMASARAWTNAGQYGLWAITFLISAALLASRGSIGIAVAQLAAYTVYGIVSLRSAAVQLCWSELSHEFRRNLVSTKFLAQTQSER